MLPTQPGRREQECSGISHLLVEVPHRGVEQLHPDPQGFLPRREVHVLDRCFDIEGGKPVHALDASVAGPGIDLAQQLIGGGSIVDGKDVDVILLETLH